MIRILLIVSIISYSFNVHASQNYADLKPIRQLLSSENTLPKDHTYRSRKIYEYVSGYSYNCQHWSLRTNKKNGYFFHTGEYDAETKNLKITTEVSIYTNFPATYVGQFSLYLANTRCKKFLLSSELKTAPGQEVQHAKLFEVRYFDGYRRVNLGIGFNLDPNTGKYKLMRYDSMQYRLCDQASEDIVMIAEPVDDIWSFFEDQHPSKKTLFFCRAGETGTDIDLRSLPELPVLEETSPNYFQFQWTNLDMYEDQVQLYLGEKWKDHWAVVSVAVTQAGHLLSPWDDTNEPLKCFTRILDTKYRHIQSDTDCNIWDSRKSHDTSNDRIRLVIHKPNDQSRSEWNLKSKTDLNGQIEYAWVHGRHEDLGFAIIEFKWCSEGSVEGAIIMENSDGEKFGICSENIANPGQKSWGQQVNDQFALDMGHHVAS